MGMYLRTAVRHIAGYAVGIGIFVLMIPYGLWYLSSLQFSLFQFPVLPNTCMRITVSLLLFVIGMGFVIWSNVFLLLKGRGGPTDIAGVAVSPQTRTLVTEGPYALTRNPMVFGVFTGYAALAVHVNSLGCMIVLILFYAGISRHFITAEEKRLLRDFGSAYERYKARTPKIFPLPKRRRPHDT